MPHRGYFKTVDLNAFEGAQETGVVHSVKGVHDKYRNEPDVCVISLNEIACEAWCRPELVIHGLKTVADLKWIDVVCYRGITCDHWLSQDIETTLFMFGEKIIISDDCITIPLTTAPFSARHGWCWLKTEACAIDVMVKAHAQFEMEVRVNEITLPSPPPHELNWVVYTSVVSTEVTRCGTKDCIDDAGEHSYNAYWNNALCAVAITCSSSDAIRHIEDVSIIADGEKQVVSLRETAPDGIVVWFHRPLDGSLPGSSALNASRIDRTQVVLKTSAGVGDFNVVSVMAHVAKVYGDVNDKRLDMVMTSM